VKPIEKPVAGDNDVARGSRHQSKPEGPLPTDGASHASAEESLPPLDEGPDAIRKLVEKRRKALEGHYTTKIPEDTEKIWGLALSGGGIRSATFCLGLLRALASKGLLLRFDLLSTVSGGGYIGATLGRLFSHARDGGRAAGIQEKLGDTNVRWFLWWLRANGRYLVPAGFKDTAFAVALYLRNFLGVQFELGLLALSLGLVLVGFDLLAWWAAQALALNEGYLFFTMGAGRVLAPWLPSVAFLLFFPAVVGAVQVAAFWDIAWLKRATRPLKIGLWVVVLAFTVAFGFFSFFKLDSSEGAFGSSLRLATWWAITGLLTIWLIGVPVAQRKYLDKVPAHGELLEPWARNQLTSSLSTTFIVAIAIVAAGVADRVAWYIAFDFKELVGSGVILFVAAAVLRALLPNAAKLVPGGAGFGAVLVVARVLGYALTFLLCVWWISLVHRAVLGGILRVGDLDFAYGWHVWVLLLIPIAGYLALTGFNVAFLNLSSLHGFYRARLSRSYLGAANANRFHVTKPADQLGALEELPHLASDSLAKRAVSDVVKGDDVDLWDYRPFLAGGPVHLINLCVNESKDPRGGQFNQDRRGQLMTIASGGLHQISLRDWATLPRHSALTLASWTAISGAAFAPGLGSMTRGGISALATFAGVRTGFWWDEETRRGIKQKPWRLSFAKSAGILRETFGTFLAGKKNDWFLSDGGHFENTGAYALLAQRAEVTVVADCGADPQYRFEDLENLVRKARIDLGAEVLFQRPRKDDELDKTVARPPEDLLSVFGSINDLASDKSTACLALAIVTYAEDPAKSNILVVVKPNICRGLPVDLVNFKAKHPEFPQQTTVDQFFSEAQWESYHQLGLHLGRQLSEPLVKGLIGNAAHWFIADDWSPFEHAKDDKPIAASSFSTGAASTAAAGSAASASTGKEATKSTEPAGRLPARISAATTTVAATLSLGAAATVGVAAWQAIDAARASYSKQVSAERDALNDLAGKWAKTSRLQGEHTAEEVRAVSSLAAAVLHSADTLCPVDEAGWFQRSVLARTILEGTVEACSKLPKLARSDPCDRLLAASNTDLDPSIPWCLVPDVDAGGSRMSAPAYWGYAYGESANSNSMHPCDPVGQERAKAAGRADPAQALCENSLGGTQCEASRTSEFLGRLGKKLTAWATGDPGVGSVPAPTPPIPTCRARSWTTPAEDPKPSAVQHGMFGLARAPAPAASGAATATPTPAASGAATATPAPAASGAAAATPAAAASGAATATPAPAASGAAAATPAATASGAAVQSPAGSSAARPHVSRDACRGKTIYIQVYGSGMLESVRDALREPWRAQGAAVPSVEDVWASARANGRTTPLPVKEPTIRKHDTKSDNCVAAMKLSVARPAVAAKWKEEPLAARLKPTFGVIEVWIPPGAELP